MSTPPPLPPDAPPPIEYRSPRPYALPPPIPHPWKKFFCGLGIGTAVSGAVWIPAFAFSQEVAAPIALAVIPLAKLATGITFTCIRNWRPLGIGVLISLALGFFIFFGACMANLNFH